MVLCTKRNKVKNSEATTISCILYTHALIKVILHRFSKKEKVLLYRLQGEYLIYNSMIIQSEEEMVMLNAACRDLYNEFLLAEPHSDQRLESSLHVYVLANLKLSASDQH